MESTVTQVPVMTKERFAELTGLTADVIRGMVDREQLPTIKIGRHRLVNIALLGQFCINTDIEHIPT